MHKLDGLLPGWWNGRHSGLRIQWPQGRESSNLSPGTIHKMEFKMGKVEYYLGGSSEKLEKAFGSLKKDHLRVGNRKIFYKKGTVLRLIKKVYDSEWDCYYYRTRIEFNGFYLEDSIDAEDIEVIGSDEVS